jgi:hypothetical protein
MPFITPNDKIKHFNLPKKALEIKVNNLPYLIKDLNRLIILLKTNLTKKPFQTTIKKRLLLRIKQNKTKNLIIPKQQKKPQKHQRHNPPELLKN